MRGLSLHEVCKRFGGVTAADDVTFDVPPGRITGLIGPNGAGKTTLVNLITGMLPLTSGRIMFDGRDIAAARADEISRLGFARTFQNIRLFRQASVLDNLLIGFYKLESSSLASNILGLLSARAETGRTRAMAQELLKRFGMSQFADSPAEGLSYGHQRRVEMMRALAASPTVLLLDEPVAGMNDVEAEELGRIFLEVARSGIAVLLIEHNIRFVTHLCEQVYVLDDGRVIAGGPPQEVIADPAVVTAYLGSYEDANAKRFSYRGSAGGPAPLQSGSYNLLRVTSVEVGFRGIRAVRGVSLEVDAGEMVALIGPNGAGKSTLLNCISGIVVPSAGSIRLDDHECVGASPWAISRRGLLHVPEGRQILAEMTVLENLQLGLSALGSRQANYPLEQVFALFPVLQERRSQRAGSLSGGQQQMLAIGRALMGGPRLLLLDEPSLGLAPVAVQQVFATLRSLNETGLTIVLVEQNAKLALQSTHRAYVIEQGRIVHSGASRDLAEDSEIMAHYLGQSASVIKGTS